MPPGAASAQAPAVEQPRHPLHALTTCELVGQHDRDTIAHA
jgi:hypothetical protein